MPGNRLPETLRESFDVRKDGTLIYAKTLQRFDHASAFAGGSDGMKGPRVIAVRILHSTSRVLSSLDRSDQRSLLHDDRYLVPKLLRQGHPELL